MGHHNQGHEVEKKGKNGEEIAREMIPFLIYAIIPLAITIALALTFGPPY